MKMKRSLYTLIVMAMASVVVACDEHYITYQGPEYVMFADSLSTHMVLSDGSPFEVVLSSTVACDYDRRFGVEVVDAGSNAIEGLHYSLKSNSVVIPAGELTAKVEVQGHYENIEPTDSLGFTLQLVMPESLKWDDLYTHGDRTKVVMYKSCPFDINNFTGWCVLSSLFIYSYPGDNTSYQRLIRSELHPTEEQTILLRDAFYDGYDVTLRFCPEDPARPLVEMDSDQVISDEASVLGWILGDDHILVENSPYYDSYFNACQRFVELWIHTYVEKVGERIGSIGHFYNILEWVSDEEADRLRREEGM